MNVPIYNEAIMKNLPVGLYLGLMHGRDSEDENMDGWGYGGPCIGPLNYVHTTYGNDIRMEFSEGHEEHIRCYDALFPENTIHSSEIELYTNKHNELVKCNGKFYGDWTVFYNSEGK